MGLVAAVGIGYAVLGQVLFEEFVHTTEAAAVAEWGAWGGGLAGCIMHFFGYGWVNSIMGLLILLLLLWGFLYY